jgi:serralysin
MASVAAAQRSYSPETDGLLSGLQWAAPTVTYSFPSDAVFYGTSYGWSEPQTNFEALNGLQISAARSAFAMVASFTNLDLIEVPETATAHGEVRMAMSDVPTTAWTYTLEDAFGGDIWFNNSTGWYDAPIKGNQGFWAFLHEIGHSLGLKHPQEIGAYGTMPDSSDAMEFSVISYRSYAGSTAGRLQNEPGGYAQTFMPSDIAALQQMYGADFTARSGNTTYRWDPSTGQAFIDGIGQGVPVENRVFMAVWDGDGVDTYDFGNYASDLSVDLRPGHWTTTATEQLAYLGGFRLARGNIANSHLYAGDRRSLIENATGGSGNDQLIGNSAANNLRGGRGADRLTGLEGADTLVGGQGNDVLRGGHGSDAFVFATKPAARSNVDKIADFHVKGDALYFDNAIFKSLGRGSPDNPTQLKKAFFATGDDSRDSNDFLLYDRQKGVLFYDPDGSGFQAAVKVATLSKMLKLSSTDIFVI